MDLALVYFLILGFAVFMYVLLDGFDLGVGILYPWFEQQEEKDLMMRSISHVWDGNETWLVFGGVILFAAFPAAYATITSTFYLPIMLMLFSLIFRGVAFEYRFKADTSRVWWDFAFSAGSSIAAFCQGLMLGALVQGVPANAIDQSSWHWLSPFAILTGFSVMAGYAFLASAYLYMKTRGRIQQKAARTGRRLLAFVFVALVVISLWTVIAQDDIRARWFNGWNFFVLSPLPVITCLLLAQSWKAFGSPQHESHAFWCGAGVFLLGFAGLVVSVFPYLVPRSLTLWQAAAPNSSLSFLIVGIAIFVPLICLYTLWGYKVFSGKVEDYQEGY